ncbi:hypothetical protein [Lignipirellula cremea]|uniref:Uncharacterized protein n=1 Tax=Lignipirellula cremea TaxID=2528010 RepID=A0A518DSN2_9BACT|nr:hypothetical protein [Lignipirellula cremea]QDU94834.1 hypothetical protein Pla8534_26420 [Lignipirellula cremea]
MRGAFIALIGAYAFAGFALPAFAQLGDNQPKSDERVRKILEEREIKYEVDKDGDFKVVFETTGDRSQLAFIKSTTNEYGNFEIREIWSPAYAGEPFSPEVAFKLLEDSQSKKLGHWEKHGKYGVFVVRIAASADSDSLWNAMKAALQSADAMEKEITDDKDEF